MDMDVETMTDVSKSLTDDQNIQDISSQEKPADFPVPFIAPYVEVPGGREIASNNLKKFGGEKFTNQKGGML